MWRLLRPRLAYRIFLKVWLSMLQPVQRFSLFRFSTTLSLMPSHAFFQSVFSSFAAVLFLFFAVLFQGAFHRDCSFPPLWSIAFLSCFVLKPSSNSSHFHLGGSACGVVRDLVNFPLSRSSSSCVPTFLKISIYSSWVANEKWDRRRNISWESLLSTRTLHAIPKSPAFILRFSRKRRYISILPL